MTTSHPLPAQPLDLRPLGPDLRQTPTATLLKTPALELVRLVLPAGKSLARHTAPGPLLIQCLEGHVELQISPAGSEAQTLELHPGQLLYLEPRQPHALRAVLDSTLLLTIAHSIR